MTRLLLRLFCGRRLAQQTSSNFGGAADDTDDSEAPMRGQQQWLAKVGERYGSCTTYNRFGPIRERPGTARGPHRDKGGSPR